jgi:general secretion pathway protein L
MPRLFLRVLSEAQSVPDDEGYDLGVEWLIRENDGSVRGGGVTDYRGLADIADPNVEWLADPENTVVFLPSQFVLMVTCTVPGRSAAQIRRALPFAAEEFVATDIEQMHIAHDNITPGQPVACNIVAHEVMENWLACFKSLQVNPGYFVADSAVLPAGENIASVLFEGDTALVASADQAATVDRGNLVFALNTLDVARIYTINGELSDIERGQLEKNPEIESVTISEHGVLDYLAGEFAAANFINLLQDRYRPVRPKSAHAGRWQNVAALAALWLVIAFVGLLAQGWWASSEADRLEQESFAFYKATFPKESQPSSLDQLRRRMRAKLGTAAGEGESSDFVGLTAQFANVIDTNSQVESLSYTDQRRELTVEVMLKSYADLDVIKDKLANSGVAVEVVSAEQVEAGARSRLRVRYAQ